jgi:hypothetical protein
MELSLVYKILLTSLKIDQRIFRNIRKYRPNVVLNNVHNEYHNNSWQRTRIISFSLDISQQGDNLETFYEDDLMSSFYDLFTFFNLILQNCCPPPRGMWGCSLYIPNPMDLLGNVSISGPSALYTNKTIVAGSVPS